MILKGMKILIKHKVELFSIIITDCTDQETRDFFLDFTGSSK